MTSLPVFPWQPLLPELPINVSLKLKRHHEEHNGTIEQMATFICITSKSSVVVEWYKDRRELRPSRKYELRQSGLEHTLTVHNLCRADFGDYAVSIRSIRQILWSPPSIGLSLSEILACLENLFFTLKSWFTYSVNHMSVDAPLWGLVFFFF